MAHQVHHLTMNSAFIRPQIHLNTLQQPRNWTHETDPAIEAFHKTLPHYAETQLHSLPSIATELGFRHVFLKDESTRFGLPAFKILGASWAVQRAVCQRLGLPPTTSLEDAKRALQQRRQSDDGESLRLVTTTEGNWGRACARMAKYLGLPCKIFVPGLMPAATRELLRGEGAEVVPLEEGSYDDCIAALREEAAEKEREGALMVMDTSWEGFEECGQWVTEGYSTMLTETSRQITAQTGLENPPILALVSVGVGSWAQSVVSYYKSVTPAASTNRILTVEPTTGPCFKECLHTGTLTPIKTSETIMNGMNCGTTSLIAWPVLRDGVDAAVTAGDTEAHENVGFLKAAGVDAGPCGAATLAGLRAVCRELDVGGAGLEGLGLGKKEREGMLVVLFSTEGGREYKVPEEE